MSDSSYGSAKSVSSVSESESLSDCCPIPSGMNTITDHGRGNLEYMVVPIDRVVSTRRFWRFYCEGLYIFKCDDAYGGTAWGRLEITVKLYSCSHFKITVNLDFEGEDFGGCVDCHQSKTFTDAHFCDCDENHSVSICGVKMHPV
jgi:hypothetical protein